MSDFLPFIVIGLATGAAYGLAGLGLVLTYKTSGIFNFGYGAVAALIVFLFYWLHTDSNLAWPLAALISVGIFAPLLGLALELIARSLASASETVKVAATIGLILVAESVGLLWHPLNQPTVPDFLPQSTVDILGVNVTWDEIILFSVCVVASGVLWWFFQSVRLGVLMRGVVDNAELVSMSGDDPVRVRRWAWVIGTMFAGVAGLMLAPLQQLNGIDLSTVMFPAFGAAAIGLFTSMPLTFAGGLLIGIAGALADKYAATISWVGGIPASLPFIVLFLVLVVIPPGRLAQRRFVAQLRTRMPYQAPTPIRLGAGAIAVALLAIVPIVQGSYVTAWSAALIDVILFLSLGLLVRRSGQISLCQLAFAAVGAATFGHFAADHVPWLLAVALAVLVAVPVGAIVAIPAVRVSGVFLALATLGFGILAEEIFYTRPFLFGSTPIGIAEPRPDVSIAGWHLYTDNGFFYLLLLITVIVVVVYAAISNGRLGRLLSSLADSPLALETQGTTSSVLKVIVFCIAAAMASLAGALMGMLYHYGLPTFFPPFNSIYIVAILIIITVGDPWFAVLAAIGYTVIPSYIQLGTKTTSILELLFGVGCTLAAYGTRAGGTPARLRAFLDRLGGRHPAAVTAGAVAALDGLGHTADVAGGGLSQPSTPTRPVTTKTPIAVPTSRGEGLVLQELSVVFGGVRAVDGVDLTARAGIITGLVGPNGAGKTTIFNACSGLNRPTSGRIALHGIDVNRKGPAQRARLGLGRTFQRTQLFNSLTVRQNVAMGREASMAGANPLTQVFGSGRANRLIESVVDDALALTGTTAIADAQAGLLPIGQRRLVELARALAGPFDLFLLDEPSSGLDGRETEQFGRVLRTVVEQRGCGILLVEHDMALVREVCDHVYVLEFGQLIFEGTSDEMLASEQVRAAYLGDVAPAGASS